jgi:hypothetical protein
VRGKAIASIIAEWQNVPLGLPPASELKPRDLPRAVAAFAFAGVPGYAKAGWPELFWPWRRPRFRPGDQRANLLRAGALILAELERLDRLADCTD